MMTDRERLADLLAYNPTARDLALKKADELLAAGVTLPPAPKPPLLTEQQVGDAWNQTTTVGSEWAWAPWTGVGDAWRARYAAFATAAAEAAIRGRVREKTEGTYECPIVMVRNTPNVAIGVAPSGLLALFGLEGE